MNIQIFGTKKSSDMRKRGSDNSRYYGQIIFR